MTVTSMFRHFLRPNANDAHIAAERRESEQPIRLPPLLEANELPPEFEDVLEVQVLGYRERLTTLYGHRRCVLDPVWTVVPKDR
jgi:hypothetical protein